MKPNKVSPCEGELVWRDEPRSGKTKNGKDWQSVDFVIKYTDENDNEAHIMFNAFGNEKVNTIYAADIGTPFRVTWKPSAREYNGRWWGKNEVLELTELGTQSRKGTELPAGSPGFKDDDLPY